MCVSDIWGTKGGGTPGAMVEIEGSVRPAEGHGRSDFGGGKGAVVIGIRQA